MSRRNPNPSANSHSNNYNNNRSDSQNPRLTIKFLISNSLAGSLIGTGGSAIKELVEVSEARLTVSSIDDVFPGTSDRIILISGSNNSVDVAQTLLWDMFAMNASAVNKKAVVWSPKTASQNPGEYDEIQVSGKITIPASAGGLILGRGGNTLRSMAEESGAKVQMSSKDEAVFTQERVLTISGNTGSCSKCVTLIINKLSEDLESAQFVNRGVNYSYIPPGGQSAPFFQDNNNNGRQHGNRRNQNALPENTEVVANVKISLTVPDSLVGNILGRQGVALREIMHLSGAKVSVSNRADSIPEDGEVMNRIVTITGSTQTTQTAHALITQKLQQSSNRSSSGAQNGSSGRRVTSAPHSRGPGLNMKRNPDDDENDEDEDDDA